MVKNKDFSLPHLELFYKLIQYGSFTNTAKVLGVSKAAVSHSIKTLENQLKVTLINRTTRAISLTHEGKLLYRHCVELHDKVENIKETIKSFHKKPSGTLRISCNPFFANHLLPILNIYTKKFPSVNIQVDIEERLPSLKDETVDIVFGVNWQPPEDIVARKIATTRYVLCASPKYIKENGKPQKIEDIFSYDYIPHKERTSPIVALKQKVNFDKTVSNLSSNNIDFIKKCVLQSLGIAQFHEYIVKEDIENGNLVELLPEAFTSEEKIYMYYQKEKFVQPKIKEFVTIALANFKEFDSTLGSISK